MCTFVTRGQVHRNIERAAFGSCCTTRGTPCASENNRGIVRHFGQFFDEYRTMVLQAIDNIFVVHHFHDAT